MFDYAETAIDTLLLYPGGAGTVESKPQTVYVSNPCGSVEIRAEDIPDGLRLYSRSILKSAMYSANVYDEVKAIMGGRAGLRNIEVICVEAEKAGPDAFPKPTDHAKRRTVAA